MYEFPPNFDDGRPTIDYQLANELVDKYIIIGITYVDSNREVLSYDQLHGIVQSFDPRTGFAVALKGKRAGESYDLPPDTRGFKRAIDGGVYTLYETDEEIENVDFTSNWTVEKNENKYTYQGSSTYR